MNTDTFIEKLFPLLITGDRKSARAFVAEAITCGWTPEEISENGFWPILDSINTLYRSDQMTSVAHHYATRLLRSLVDQVQAGYTQKNSNNKSILLFCGPSEADDLAAQIVADLCEADGWEVRFGSLARHCLSSPLFVSDPIGSTSPESGQLSGELLWRL